MSIDHPLFPTPRPGHEFATLGGGCFWCLEAVYMDLKGVIDVESGYSGGTVSNPTYNAVCGGRTGHAEVVRVEFDPSLATYRQILEVIFTIHDPTTLNRQGADTGTQYRSVIFYHSPEQEQIAKDVIAEVAKLWPAKIVTELEPAPTYYRAEAYHQEYFPHNPNQGYCAAVVGPKLAKFRKTHAKLRKAG